MKKNKLNESILSKMIMKNSMKMVKLLIEYAKENNTILEINMNGKGDNYPLISAVKRNNSEMIKLLMEYA